MWVYLEKQEVVCCACGFFGFFHRTNHIPNERLCEKELLAILIVRRWGDVRLKNLDGYVHYIGVAKSISVSFFSTNTIMKHPNSIVQFILHITLYHIV